MENARVVLQMPAAIIQFLFSSFQFLISAFCFSYAARASLAERLEWKPLISVLDISSRWIWLVPS